MLRATAQPCTSSFPSPMRSYLSTHGPRSRRPSRRVVLPKSQIGELWDSLFLGEKEVQELLAWVKENAEHPFVYVMFAFTAFTGRTTERSHPIPGSGLSARERLGVDPREETAA